MWPPDRLIIQPANEKEREAVRTAQRALGLPETGALDDATKQKLTAVQLRFKLPFLGALDRATAEVLDQLYPPSLRE